jgi:hypothetical protein
VIKIEHTGPPAPNQRLQHCLSLNQRQRTKILSVQVQQIERDEDALALSENQVSKGRPARFIETANLTIEHGTFGPEVCGDPGCEFVEPSENLPIPGNQFATSVLQMGKRPEAVDLQFVNELIGVERFGSA